MSACVISRPAAYGAALAVLSAATLLAGCANPREFIPDSGVYKAAQRRMSKPAPRVWANYCGLGTRHGNLSHKPLNVLDRACLDHDICYIEAHAGCACDDALVRAAAKIAEDRRQPDDVRRKARQVRLVFSAGFCRVFPRGLLPPRDKRLLATLPRGNPHRRDAEPRN